MPTVRDVTFDLLRRLDLTTVVGNPGSTEETFLKNFPADFTYILALQESSVVGIADGLSQGLGKPVLVNVHTGAGMGNAMGCILTAYLNKTPLILTAGQQTRDMLLGEPFLTNKDETLLPQPWVKWSYEPKRPQDVPGAFMRAYAMAVQQPQGPVFLSLPLDDWEKDIDAVDVLRSVSTRQAPDPQRLADFALRINASRNPVLVYGADLSRSQAWEQGIALAEAVQAPVWLGPFTERVPFPHNHPLYAGVLPPAVGPLGQTLAGHDLVLVVGAPVFRYYPWVAGQTLPAGAKLLQIIDDPYEAGKSVVGDSLVADSRLAVEALLPLLTKRAPRGPVRPAAAQAAVPAMSAVSDDAPVPLTPKQIFAVLSEVTTGSDCIVVNESPSNMADLAATPLGLVTTPDSSFVMASGGLGWGMPAAVGLGLAEQASGRKKPVVAVIGDGSFQYSLQSIWTGVQHGAHVVYVVLRNEEYGILKAFARLEQTPGVPGLDLPGLDIVSLGKGYGAATAKAATPAEIRQAFAQALSFQGVTVIEIAADKHVGDLIPK
jgi:benzoylformate decarboxylase